MHFNAIPIRGDFEKATKMDAESAEHHVHRPTIGDITRFGDFVAQRSWFQTFEQARANF